MKIFHLSDNQIIYLKKAIYHLTSEIFFFAVSSIHLFHLFDLFTDYGSLSTNKSINPEGSKINRVSLEPVID
jgi:hypothetical protein